MTNHKILGIFANHTTNMIKYNITLNNISILKKHLTNIIIIDTIDQEYGIKLEKDFKNDIDNNSFIIKYLFIKNDNYYDFGKWIYVLKTLNQNKLNEYDYILFINDSIIITENIKNYFIYLNNHVSDKINLYGYNDSTQIKYHYQSYFFSIKRVIINKFIKFFESKKNKIFDLESLVKNVELNICEIDPNHDCLIKIGNDYNMTKNIYWENEVLYKFLLAKDIFAIFKLKKIYDFYKDYKIVISGYNIVNFDYEFYKNQYDDILNSNMSNKEMLDHFVKIGQFEGRKCNPKFNVILPDYYREKLDLINLLYFFDLPFDFDPYYYKRYYSDVEKLSVFDAIFHYLNCGVYQSRKYNKITEDNLLNTYINNFYVNILKLNNKINESYIYNSNFSIYSYHLSNIFEYPDYKNNEKSNLKLIYEFINNNLNINDISILTKYSNDAIHKLLSIIDYDIYKQIHPETHNFTYIEIIQHYIKSGNSHSYKLPLDFDYNNYARIYSDISKLNINQLKKHYIEYGFKENRIYKIPADFSAAKYRELYGEIDNKLLGMSDKELINNYLYEGIAKHRIYKIPNDFNPDIYKKIYKDLKELNNIQLNEHYMNIGIFENRIYKIPSDFDAGIYRKIYPELENMTDVNELSNHYIFNGLDAGYIYKLPSDFNINLYKILYKDNIISYFSKDVDIITDDEIKDYYLYKGIRQGHIYKIPNDFNHDLYKKIYSHSLNNLNNKELEEHYLFIGAKNGLIYKIPYDFNPSIYKRIYNDLSELDDQNLINHYLFYGINENRIYKIPFNFLPCIYKKIYGFEHFTDNEAIDYYLFNGIKEKHIYNIPGDFNIELYKNIYNLENMSDEQIREHYLFIGIKNGFIYKIPTDFNSYIYSKIYNDLNGLNHDELVNHYLYIGIKQNRIYKIPTDFNPELYKNIYDDLRDLSEEDLINHYLFYGISENRIYNINDFDPHIYKELYEDLRNLSDSDLKCHYIKYGLYEGRVYKR